MGFEATEMLIRLIAEPTRPGTAHDAADQARRPRLVPRRSRTDDDCHARTRERRAAIPGSPPSTRNERVEDLLAAHDPVGEGRPNSAAPGCSSSPTARASPRSGRPTCSATASDRCTRISGASSLRPAEGSARLANAIQSHLVEETRLGIPAIVHEEICSGLMAAGRRLPAGDRSREHLGSGSR